MAIPAFTDAELSFIRTLRSAEIRVDWDGRLKIWFPVSDEYAAKTLHDLIARESVLMGGATP